MTERTKPAGTAGSGGPGERSEPARAAGSGGPGERSEPARAAGSGVPGERSEPARAAGSGGRGERSGSGSRSGRTRTATSTFGVGRREAHDAGAFYARFEAPELSADDRVATPAPLAEPF